MALFTQITEMFKYLLTEKLVAGLHVLTGSTKDRHREEPETPELPDEPGNEPPTAQNREKNVKTHLSSNRLGWYGKR